MQGEITRKRRRRGDQGRDGDQIWARISRKLKQKMKEVSRARRCVEENSEGGQSPPGALQPKKKKYKMFA